MGGASFAGGTAYYMVEWTPQRSSSRLRRKSSRTVGLLQATGNHNVCSGMRLVDIDEAGIDTKPQRSSNASWVLSSIWDLGKFQRFSIL